MIAIIDYGSGNLFSVANALNFLGLKWEITSDKPTIEKSASIILPGVGAFPDAMRMLEKTGLSQFLGEQALKKPFLGICLGAQLLFDTGYENGVTAGLGLIKGTVEKIADSGMKIPHMGWNELVITQQSPLLEGVSQDRHAYFVHSYKIQTDDKFIVSYCDYGEKIPAIVSKGMVFGTQFHPEKSGGAGLKILENFGRLI